MLSVKRNGPDNNDEFRVAGFAAFADSLIEKRNYRCDCCGFRSKRFLRLLSKNGVYSQLSPEMFNVACPFCFIPNRLELAKSKAVLIYLPELTQQQLNMLSHSLFYFGYSAISNSSQFHYSKDILNRLYTRTFPIEEALGSGSHLPENMAIALKGLSSEEYEARANLLKDVRVMPVKEGYLPELAYWVEHVYRPILGDNHDAWTALFAEAQKILPDVTYGD